MFTLIVKIANIMGCLGRGIHTDRMNPRRRNIVKIPVYYDSQDRWEPGLIKGSHVPFRDGPLFSLGEGGGG